MDLFRFVYLGHLQIYITGFIASHAHTGKLQAEALAVNNSWK